MRADIFSLRDSSEEKHNFKGHFFLENLIKNYCIRPHLRYHGQQCKLNRLSENKNMQFTGYLGLQYKRKEFFWLFLRSSSRNQLVGHAA